MSHHAWFDCGRVAEWSIAAVLKTVVPRGTGGSNPSPSASKNKIDASSQRSSIHQENLTVFARLDAKSVLLVNGDAVAR